MSYTIHDSIVEYLQDSENPKKEGNDLIATIKYLLKDMKEVDE